MRIRDWSADLCSSDRLVAAGVLRFIKRVVGDAVEALEIARRAHLGDADAGGDAPLAEQVGVIAGHDLTPDAFGEAVEDDALHADRQQAELPAAQPRDASPRAFPDGDRSEQRRVGQEWVSKCKS